MPLNHLIYEKLVGGLLRSQPPAIHGWKKVVPWVNDFHSAKDQPVANSEQEGTCWQFQCERQPRLNYLYPLC